jgi:hypothetical protein
MICFPARCALLPLALFTLAVGSMAQTSATVSLDRAAFKAGDVIKASLTLDIPSPCDGGFIVPFKRDSGQGEIDLYANSTKGSQTISVSAQPTFDDPGGNFVADSALIRCIGFQNPRHVLLSEKVQFTIIPVPDTYAYPTKATVALTVSQKQFLETKAVELDRLLVKFANGVEQYPNTTEAQKQFLVTIIESAQLSLNDSESEYKRQILKPDQTLPVFFEDFRANYRDLETDIKARKIVEMVDGPHLQLAQLKKRPKPQSPATSSTTLSPDAIAVSHLVEDNAKAYRYVEETGGATFTTALMSIPAGARVRYRRTTQQDFEDYPTPTNVNIAIFPMAYMQFRFHKENCGDDQFLRINPWDNPSATIKVEFTKCH